LEQRRSRSAKNSAVSGENSEDNEQRKKPGRLAQDKQPRPVMLLVWERSAALNKQTFRNKSRDESYILTT